MVQSPTRPRGSISSFETTSSIQVSIPHAVMAQLYSHVMGNIVPLRGTLHGTSPHDVVAQLYSHVMGNIVPLRGTLHGTSPHDVVAQLYSHVMGNIVPLRCTLHGSLAAEKSVALVWSHWDSSKVVALVSMYSATVRCSQPVCPHSIGNSACRLEPQGLGRTIL